LNTELGALGPLEHEYASGGLSEYEEAVYTWDEFDPPPTLSPPHTTDFSSVRRTPASLMTSVDELSTRRQPSLPLGVAVGRKHYKGKYLVDTATTRPKSSLAFSRIIILVWQYLVQEYLFHP